ncbi:MFS transporter [Microbacterium paludicola]|uniref:MFS transporter n=1 Tax=Microbacterium paludicola TaxID=300019 RepID=UPI001432058A|nr:MFS transporter [Microbacterium paludicola]MBF0817178.1 MFS transporter [Microbacterium paludicola]
MSVAASARVLSVFLVFLALGGLTTTVPRYVIGVLDVPIGAVGIAALATGIGGVLGRLVSGVLLRRWHPSVVALPAVCLAALSLLVTAVVPELWWLLLWRVVQGLGTGAFHTAVFTRAIGEGGGRTGRAIAFASVPLFAGTALGPSAAELLTRFVGVSWTWSVLAIPVLVVVVLTALQRHETLAASSSAPFVVAQSAIEAGMWRRLGSHATRMVHRGAVPAGACWVLLSAAWGGAQAFLPLYALDVGMSASGPLFLTFSTVVVLVRIGGAGLFDRVPETLQAIVGGACALAGAGLLAFVPSPPAVYVAVVLFALNTALGFGALMRTATAGADAAERGSAVSTFNLSFDIGVALSTAGLGIVVQATGGFAAAFAIAGGCALAGVLIVLVLPGRGLRRALASQSS